MNKNYKCKNKLKNQIIYYNKNKILLKLKENKLFLVKIN